MARYTVANVVNRAAKELGLISADISDPYSSTSAAILQLLALLEGLGQDLARRFTWQQLIQEYTFSTASGTAAYTLPSDFIGPVDATTWNRTQTYQLDSLSPVGWQRLKSGSVTSVWQRARLRNDLLYLDPTPTATETIAIEYYSAFWVLNSSAITPWTGSTSYSIDALRTNNGGKVYKCTTGGTSASSGGPTGTGTGITDGTCVWTYHAASVARSPPNLEVPSGAGQYLAYDLRLLVLGLKLAFRGAKGLDTLWNSSEFLSAVEAARARSDFGQRLSLNPQGGPKLLDDGNVPDTDFGA